MDHSIGDPLYTVYFQLSDQLRCKVLLYTLPYYNFPLLHLLCNPLPLFLQPPWCLRRYVPGAATTFFSCFSSVLSLSRNLRWNLQATARTFTFYLPLRCIVFFLPLSYLATSMQIRNLKSMVWHQAETERIKHLNRKLGIQIHMCLPRCGNEQNWGRRRRRTLFSLHCTEPCWKKCRSIGKNLRPKK